MFSFLVFLPRDCSLVRLLFSCGVCVSGWVSVTFVSCAETAKDTAIVAVERE